MMSQFSLEILKIAVWERQKCKVKHCLASSNEKFVSETKEDRERTEQTLTFMERGLLRGVQRHLL